MAARRTEDEIVSEPAASGAGLHDEPLLLRRMAGGDQQAFRVLVDRHLGAVAGIARRVLRDDAEAEDVAQETMLRLWRSGASLELGSAGVRPWLRRVASNLCIDRVRQGAKVDVTDEVPEVAEPARQHTGIENAEVARRVDIALKALPERQRLALTLFHFEGMSQVEVGNVLGISDEAVESLLARARRTLKSSLRDDWQSLVSANGS